jgi:hypothetical protein
MFINILLRNILRFDDAYVALIIFLFDTYRYKVL